MDENIKQILFDAAESIFKKTGLKLSEVNFTWLDISTAAKKDFMLYEVRIDGVLK